MRIGGKARWYAELLTKKDAEDACSFARSKKIPLIVLGGGSNTIFADGVIAALVVRIQSENMTMENSNGRRTRIVVGAGKPLGCLVNNLAVNNLDLSALTGIPGTVGGAIFGNAGQGASGIWIDYFVESVTAYVDGRWKIFTRDECKFRYRDSAFKTCAYASRQVIIWEIALSIPSRQEADVKMEIERLLKKRIETQPHLKTAGSCFKSLSDGTPAWQLIAGAGLRGEKIGGVQISEKHANFLMNTDNGTFDDVKAVIGLVKKTAPRIEGVEMRLYGEDGANLWQ
ncbi:FAD-binding protein [Candidatus Peregrinibacteria bacterium]|nr:FAD-binding protein [Candidatus Peregrinibacteria bacterium]